MHFDILAPPLKAIVVENLGPRLSSLSASEGDGEEFALHESCRLWILDLPQRIPDGAPLESFRRRIDLWHHQVWRGGQPLFYARSAIPPSSESGAPPIRLCKVARSPLAAQVNATFTWLDAPENAAEIGEPQGEDWLVRLLIVPRFDLYAIALIEQERIRKAVPLLQPAEAGQPRALDPPGLRTELLDRPMAFGVA